MINVVWFMAGAISAVFVLLIMAIIVDWAEECGHKKIMKIVEEYEDRLKNQKEQIEEVGHKAREYQDARFKEERARLTIENFDSGFNAGKKEVMEKVKAMVKSGDITINRKGE